MGAEILNMRALDYGLKNMPKAALREARREIAIYARQARDEIKAATPVLTGNLRKSIKVKGTKPKGGRFSYRVIASTDGTKGGKGHHYHLVEYGTVKMKARHFAKPIKDKYVGNPTSLLNKVNHALTRATIEAAKDASK